MRRERVGQTVAPSAEIFNRPNGPGWCTDRYTEFAGPPIGPHNPLPAARQLQFERPEALLRHIDNGVAAGGLGIEHPQAVLLQIFWTCRGYTLSGGYGQRLGVHG